MTLDSWNAAESKLRIFFLFIAFVFKAAILSILFFFHRRPLHYLFRSSVTWKNPPVKSKGRRLLHSLLGFCTNPIWNFISSRDWIALFSWMLLCPSINCWRTALAAFEKNIYIGPTGLSFKAPSIAHSWVMDRKTDFEITHRFQQAYANKKNVYCL
jgi:hypothetical protein